MTEEIINLRSLIESKNDIFYCEVDKCNVVQKLKQENAEFTEQLDEECLRVTKLATENTRLEQENAKLKSQYNCYACDTCNGKEDYRNMKRHCENAIKTVHTYRKALEEIREMCKTMLQGVTSNCINNTPYLIALNSMENKINEVLQ